MAEVQQSSLRNRLLRLLPPEDFALLSLQRVPLPARLVLVEPGVPIEYLYFMEDGMTSITTDMSNAKVELGMIGREGLVAAAPVMLDSDRSPYLHFVQMPGAGLRISRKELLAAVDRSAVLAISLIAKYPGAARTDGGNGICQRGLYDRGPFGALAFDVPRPCRWERNGPHP